MLKRVALLAIFVVLCFQFGTSPVIAKDEPGIQAYGEEVIDYVQQEQRRIYPFGWEDMG